MPDTSENAGLFIHTSPPPPAPVLGIEPMLLCTVATPSPSPYNNRTPSGCSLFRNSEILLDGESALQPSSLFCHTHTAYAAVARDTTAATAGAVDGIVDPASSTSASTVSRARRLPSRRGRGAYQAGVCAGVRGIEELSARWSGCEARTAHRARPTRRACRAEIEGE
eukprot:scaffold42107_cov62-Phaeocystis_antarctica.AAC.3